MLNEWDDLMERVVGRGTAGIRPAETVDLADAMKRLRSALAATPAASDGFYEDGQRIMPDDGVGLTPAASDQRHFKQSVNGCVLCDRRWSDHSATETQDGERGPAVSHEPVSEDGFGVPWDERGWLDSETGLRADEWMVDEAFRLVEADATLGSGDVHRGMDRRGVYLRWNRDGAEPVYLAEVIRALAAIPAATEPVNG